MRNMEVVAPGSGTEGMVPGVTEDCRKLNELPLSEQSKPWAVFSGKPLIYEERMI